MTDELILTLSTRATNNRTILFTINRCENDMAGGKRFEDWLSHPEREAEGYFEPFESDSKSGMTYPSGSHYYVSNLLKFLYGEETQEKKVYYRLTISLMKGSEILNTYSEYYNYIEAAYTNLGEYLASKKSIPFEELKDLENKDRWGEVKEYKIRKEIENIWNKDVALERNSFREAWDRIPVETRKKCKEYCKEQLAKKSLDSSWSPCNYSCVFSDGNEERSGYCICKQLGLKAPNEWEI